MSRYKCKKCKTVVKLLNQTMSIVDGKVRTKESKCKKCGEWMKEVKEDFTGFPTIIRNE